MKKKTWLEKMCAHHHNYRYQACHPNTDHLALVCAIVPSLT
jgi:hypothetical protein